MVSDRKGRKSTHAQTHYLIWGQGFLDGRSGRWRDSSDIESVSVKVSVCARMCVSVLRHTHAQWMCLHAFVCLWKFVYLWECAYALFFVYAHVCFVCVCVSSLLLAVYALSTHTGTHTHHSCDPPLFVPCADGTWVFPLLFCPRGPSALSVWAGGSHMPQLNWPNSHLTVCLSDSLSTYLPVFQLFFLPFYQLSLSAIISSKPYISLCDFYCLYQKSWKSHSLNQFDLRGISVLKEIKQPLC